MARAVGDTVQQGKLTNAPELVKKAMKARGYTQVMLANELGYKGQSSISSALNGRNMQINVLVGILDALGFDIIIKDRNGNNRENCWKVESVVRDDVAGTGSNDDERR